VHGNEIFFFHFSLKSQNFFSFAPYFIFLQEADMSAKEPLSLVELYRVAALPLESSNMDTRCAEFQILLKKGIALCPEHSFFSERLKGWRENWETSVSRTGLQAISALQSKIWEMMSETDRSKAEALVRSAHRRTVSE